MDKELTTERLYLKPLKNEDDVILFGLHSDPEVMRFIRKPDQDIFQTKKKISEILKYSKNHPDLGLWNAFTKDTDEFVGWGVLVHIEHNCHYPIEVGYRLHHKYWGQGLATEISTTLLNYAKDKGLAKISGLTSQDNLASQRVLEKIGMKFLEDRLYYETQAKYYEIEL